MKIEFIGDALTFTDALKGMLTRKLERSLGRMDVSEVIATLNVDGSDQKLSFKILDWSGEYHASGSARSVYDYIDDLIAKSKSMVIGAREKKRA